MTSEEELLQFRQEKSEWQDQLAHRDELIAQLQQQQAVLSEQMQALQSQLKKDRHNSHLPPSSDRFGRQPKSLRQKNGKKAGGQPGHPGSTLMQSQTPDTVIVHPFISCGLCLPCRVGDDMHCLNGSFTGINRDGGFADLKRRHIAGGD